MGIALLLAGLGFGVLTFRALTPETERKEERAQSRAAVPVA